jgi:HK97 family phage prohead protease
MTIERVTAPKFGRAAEVRSASYDEADNSVEVIWTTGAAVRRRDWRSGDYYSEVLEVTPEAVRLDRLNAGAPFLDTHDDWSLRSVIGSVVPGSAKIDKGRGVARVRLSGAAGDADVVEKIRSGIIRNVSVGYAIHRVEKTENADADDEWRVVDWEPMEISAVPIPADAGSQIRDGKGAETDCEILLVRTAETETRRARMQARQDAAVGVTAVGLIQRAVRAGADEAELTNGFVAAIELAERTAANGGRDPLTIATEAWRAAPIWFDVEDRAAAFGAAFVIAARR